MAAQQTGWSESEVTAEGSCLRPALDEPNLPASQTSKVNLLQRRLRAAFIFSKVPQSTGLKSTTARPIKQSHQWTRAFDYVGQKFQWLVNTNSESAKLAATRSVKQSYVVKTTC